MTASISPVLVRLAPCGPQMRLYVYETGGRALTDHPSKPGGTCVKVCACVLGGLRWCVLCVCVSCEGRGREQTGASAVQPLHHLARPGSCAATCLRGFQYPVCARGLRSRRRVYPRNAVHYICMCVWLLHAPALLAHAYLRRQTELEGESNSLSPPVKNLQQASVVWRDDAPFSHSPVITSALEQETRGSLARAELFTGWCCD